VLLGDFHTLVVDEMNKGSVHTSRVPQRTLMAAQVIERNRTFKHMERFVEFTQPAAQRAFPFPSTRVKKFEFLRFAGTDGDFNYLVHVDPSQIENNLTGSPVGFWMDGKDYIWFDVEPDEAIDFEMSFVEYSNWLLSDNNYTNWLLDNGTDLLLAQTMIYMAPIAREPGWIELYKDMRERGERTLYLADEELRQSMRDEIMIYK
jgi:hypothetical protein